MPRKDAAPSRDAIMCRPAAAAPLTPQMSAWCAFGHLLRQLAERQHAALEAARSTDDPEAVHAARVALRRMRSAVRGFGDMLAPKVATRLSTDLAERFRRLGPLRDADVRAAALAGGPGARAAEAEAARLRSALRDALRRGGDDLAPRLEKLLSRPEKAITGARRQRLAEAPVGILASRALHHAWTEILAFGADLDRLPAEDLHEFRKRAKDMRYLADFFGPLWPEVSEARMLRDMSVLQDGLGALNDLAVMRADFAAGRIDHLPPDAEAGEARARTEVARVWAELRGLVPWWAVVAG